MFNKLFDYITHALLGWVVSVDGQQRLRTGILSAVLAVAAKLGLPPGVGDWLANVILGLGVSLVASFTVRQPELPAPPATADGLPQFDDLKPVDQVQPVQPVQPTVQPVDTATIPAPAALAPK